MASFYISAEAECSQCAKRGRGAQLRLTTDGQDLDSIPTYVASQVEIDSLPPGWERLSEYGDRSMMRCAACVAKEREEQAAREAEAAKRKARRSKKKS